MSKEVKRDVRDAASGQSPEHLTSSRSISNDDIHSVVDALSNPLVVPQMVVTTTASTVPYVTTSPFNTSALSSLGVRVTPTAYVQVPTAVEQIGPSSPLVCPELNTQYLPPIGIAPPTPSPGPCTVFAANGSFTTVCNHCVYAQPCLFHQRPITYTPHTFPVVGGVSQNRMTPSSYPSYSYHTHPLPVVPSHPVAQVPSTDVGHRLTLPTRTPTTRLKRSSDPMLPSSDNVQPLTRQQKMRRFSPSHEEASTSEVRPHQSNLNEGHEEPDPGSQQVATCCCGCRNSFGYLTCTCYCHHVHHHHHICPRYPQCWCQRTVLNQQRNYRRETEINPVHDLLLAARAAQVERQQRIQNQWFQRHAVHPRSLVGLDVVSGRRTTPLVIYPHYHHLLESSFMIYMSPNEGVRFGLGAAPTSDLIPVGATVEQICRFSTMYKYSKVVGGSENEQERCIICLSDYENDEELRALRCTHHFHVTCIDRWLLYNKKCPVCRVDLDKTAGTVSTAS